MQIKLRQTKRKGTQNERKIEKQWCSSQAQERKKKKQARRTGSSTGGVITRLFGVMIISLALISLGLFGSLLGISGLALGFLLTVASFFACFCLSEFELLLARSPGQLHNGDQQV